MTSRSTARAESRSVLLVRSGGWAATCASARGSAHVRAGTPNQDAVAVGPLHPPRRGVVAAVADGHGGSAYVRSQIGARCAVEVAVALAAETPGPPDPRRLVADWRQVVTEHAAAHPFTSAERSLMGPGDLCAYGSTLLLAVADDSGTWVLKLGDGDVLAVASTGATRSPVADDARLVAGVTTSLCLPTAAADCAQATLTDPSLQLLVLASDGYGAAFAEATWPGRVGRDLLGSVATHGLDAVASSLPAWLAESARTGGDDVSVALVAREGRPPAGPDRPQDDEVVREVGQGQSDWR